MLTRSYLEQRAEEEHATNLELQQEWGQAAILALQWLIESAQLGRRALEAWEPVLFNLTGRVDA